MKENSTHNNNNMKPYLHLQEIPSLPLEPTKTLIQSTRYHTESHISLLSSSSRSDCSKISNSSIHQDSETKDVSSLEEEQQMNVKGLEESTQSRSNISNDDGNVNSTATLLVTDDSCGRERLKRHRGEVAGRVWIPEIWGQEDLLKDWIDCSAFDAGLMSNRIMSARSALAEEGRRANSGRLRIENRC